MFALSAVKMLVDAITEDASPRQLAWGVAWGMMIGLVPKENLIAAALVFILCTLRVNIAAGVVSAFVFSWVGLFTDPVADGLGNELLTAPALQEHWTTLYNLPVVPWTAFNNTVVLGSLLFGLVLMYPVRCAAEPLAARFLPPVYERLNKLKVAQWLSRAETAINVGRS